MTLFGASGTDNATYRGMLEEGEEAKDAEDYVNIVESHP